MRILSYGEHAFFFAVAGSSDGGEQVLDVGGAVEGDGEAVDVAEVKVEDIVAGESVCFQRGILSFQRLENLFKSNLDLRETMAETGRSMNIFVFIFFELQKYNEHSFYVTSFFNDEKKLGGFLAKMFPLFLFSIILFRDNLKKIKLEKLVSLVVILIFLLVCIPNI